MFKIAKLIAKLLFQDTNYLLFYYTIFCEENQLVVKLRHLIKDGSFDKLHNTDKTKVVYRNALLKTATCVLPLSFPRTKNKNLFLPDNPLLLIPLFHITEEDEKAIKCYFFEKNSLNKLWCSLLEDSKTPVFRFDPLGGPKAVNYISFRESQIFCSEGDIYGKRSGYFIFRDPLTKQAVLYVGAFLNKTVDEFSSFYKKYMSSKSVDITEGEVIFELSLNSSSITNGLRMFLPEVSSFHYNFQIITSSPIDFSANFIFHVKLKATIKKGELCFVVDIDLVHSGVNKNTCVRLRPASNRAKYVLEFFLKEEDEKNKQKILEKEIRNRNINKGVAPL
ncbi:hypothetical protein CDIK_1301 [Cucumispora dikerogammari]|nr:hypothetical protein CDIK_1301 [Cucumispora dikerogammari]